jgi:hypothetical protein
MSLMPCTEPEVRRMLVFLTEKMSWGSTNIKDFMHLSYTLMRVLYYRGVEARGLDRGLHRH